MKAFELKSKLDYYCMHRHTDDEVVIHIKERSIGGIVGVPIKSFSAGFDWDAGRLILEPERPLAYYDHNRDTPKPAIRVVYENGHKGVYNGLYCPNCEASVSDKKDINYCPRCGQKLDFEGIKEIKI